MDLTSPRKVTRGQESKQETDEEIFNDAEIEEALDPTSPRRDKALVSESTQEGPQNLSQSTRESTMEGHSVMNTPAPADQKRTNYPFDDETEPYSSELEDDDLEEFTLERRKLKDELERELRDIDKLEAKEVDGDQEVLQQFETFMRNKTKRSDDAGEYSSTVSTVGMYTRALKNDILPAFHTLFDPFDSRWILDCTSPKNCKFDGNPRFYMKPEEPIYIT